MAKPFVNVLIPANEDLAANAEIPLGTTQHQSCDIVRQNGSGIILNGHNHYNAYEVDAVITMAPKSGTAEEIGFSVLKDGTIVPGSTRVATVEDSITIPVICMVTTDCGHPAVLTLQTTANVSIAGGNLIVKTR